MVGTAGEATETIYQSKLTGSLALVMGAEGEGMRRLYPVSTAINSLVFQWRAQCHP